MIRCSMLMIVELTICLYTCFWCALYLVLLAEHVTISGWAGD